MKECYIICRILIGKLCLREYIHKLCLVQLNYYSIRSELLMNDITDHLPIFALCNYEIEIRKVTQLNMYETRKTKMYLC